MPYFKIKFSLLIQLSVFAASKGHKKGAAMDSLLFVQAGLSDLNRNLQKAYLDRLLVF